MAASADREGPGLEGLGARARLPQPRRGNGVQRLLVVSDHTLISEAVRMALVSRGHEALALGVPGSDHERRGFAERVSRFHPSAAILLCELDRRPVVWDARSVVAATPTRWLLLTRSRDRPLWGAFVQVGVLGVLPMSTSLDTLVEVLGRVGSGHEVMSPALRQHLVGLWQTEGQEARRVAALMDSLTPRELVVLSNLHDGLTVKLIADASGVSEGTVRSQVKSILRKLEVSSQLAAVSAFRQRVQHSDLPARTREAD